MKLFKLQGEKTEKLQKLKEQQERIKDLEEVSKYTFQPVLQSNMYRLYDIENFMRKVKIKRNPINMMKQQIG